MKDNLSGYARQHPKTGKMFLPNGEVVDVISHTGDVNVMVSDQTGGGTKDRTRG